MFSVRFDKGFNYYDTSYKIVDKNKNDDKLDDIWNKANNKEFSKIMTGKQIEKEAIFSHSIPQLQKKSIDADSKEKRDNNSLFKSAINNNYPLPHQFMPPSTVLSEISSFLTDISRANTPLLPKTF